MNYSVHVPWYATAFRPDKLEAALGEIAPIALRYGAYSYSVYRAHEDRYKFVQIADFDKKQDWVAYWDGPEFTRFRTLYSGWFQVPVLYQMQDLTAHGELPAQSTSAERDAAA